MKKSFWSCALLVLSALLLTLSICDRATAQSSNTAAVRGTVTDPQGGAVSGATVTLTSTTTNAARTQTTNESGAYVFELIPPDTYRLEVESAGFRRSVLGDVRALVARPTEINVALEIGDVTETVNVTAGLGEVQINTQDATIGNNIVSQQITQLPLEARSPLSLLTLQPGVSRQGYVTGARSDQSNITLDGVDINEAQTNDIEDPVLRLNVEAVEEFRVVVTNPNAAQGRSSGAQISLITRSGGNDFHGALFLAHRNTVTTANNFFNNRAGIDRPKLIRNTFGGRFDGPIVRDRAFFMYSYEGRRDASEASALRVVPLASLGRGEVRFTNTAGATQTLNAAQLNALFPAVGLNPVALAALADAAARYPSNTSDSGDGLNTGGFRFNASTPVSLNAHVLRLDVNATSDGRHLLFFRGNYQYDNFTGISQFPDTPGVSTWSHPYGFAAGHTWSINSTTTNSFRYGLTRDAFSNQGDSNQNAITFRFVYEPFIFARTFNRVTPVHNIVNDFSKIVGNHSLQFGANARIIRNRRTSFAQAFDNAVTNPFFYQASGNVLLTPIPNVSTGFRDQLKSALTAVIGRFSQYSANFNFDLDGNPLPSGTGVSREFATEEYDVYAQDVWRIRPNLTLTYGLRYGVSRPVYESQGYMATPNIPLGVYLQRRLEAADRGENYTETITIERAGAGSGRPGFYSTDWNNFQPRVALAWSPNFSGGFGRRLFGGENESVIRGGFAITNDYFGQALTVAFDANNELGFSSGQTTPANSFNVTTRPAPRFTGFGQDVRTLPTIVVPAQLTFPQQQPADGQRRIEGSLDSALVSPINYSWNVAFERQLPAGFTVQAAYIGRAARNLLVGRDATQPNLNFTDTGSGQTWTDAAGALEALRSQNTALGSIGTQPFFENLYAPGLIGSLFFGDPSLSNTQAVYGLVAGDAPGCEAYGGCYGFGNDWTFIQDILDSFTGNQYFYQPQYGALGVWSTIGSSDYHAGTLSIRQRFRESFTLDFNYTLSKSLDDASGLQTQASIFTSFILNAVNSRQQRAVSDFDVRHIINVNSIWQLPFGRGRMFLSDSPGVVNALLGGWQLSSIFRWNSGLPVNAPLDFGGWPTNWNRRNYTTLTRPLQSSPTRGSGDNPPNLFSNPTAAYQSFRSGRPGEYGTRNPLREPGYMALDLGLAKSFTMPWSENHRFQIRWEVFNVTNTQRFTDVDGFVQGVDPQSSEPNPTFGNFTAIQGTPRVMQFGFRYSF